MQRRVALVVVMVGVVGMAIGGLLLARAAVQLRRPEPVHRGVLVAQTGAQMHPGNEAGPLDTVRWGNWLLGASMAVTGSGCLLRQYTLRPVPAPVCHGAVRRPAGPYAEHELLRALYQLHRGNVLSRQEYEAKRKQVMDRVQVAGERRRRAE